MRMVMRKIYTIKIIKYKVLTVELIKIHLFKIYKNNTLCINLIF